MNMKNIKTKIILSAVFLSIIGFSGAVNAAGASLYVSPASITKTAGNIFDVSVGANASGNKVCAVEGMLVFNNLTCQSITVASDAMAQSSPTCSNPYFLIGIPNCTISDKALLTVSVKAGSAGKASISPSGVDIIGEGVSLGSASISGNYTINAVSTTTPKPTPTPTTTPTQQVAQPEPETPQNVETPAQQATQENNLPVSTGMASLIATNPVWANVVWALLAIVIIFFVVYGIYLITKKKK